jgi:predicted DNA-binding transcriptional regulator YafY
VVAESVDRLDESDRQILARLADELAACLEVKPRTVGLDIERLEAVRVKLRDITAQGGTGARFGTIVTDTFEADGVRVAPPGKS